jgi:aryl-alcohol dehydrogenase-like predicted oxidoreductase
MIYRRLGRTNLQVSAVALGTVALGTRYGIAGPGQDRRPRESDALALLRYAADGGVTLFDTARAYGDAERLVGLALGHRTECIIATKVTVPGEGDRKAMTSADLRKALIGALTSSRRMLRRDVLDIVQIHNATPEILASTEIMDVLTENRGRGMIGFLGASVYSVDEAMAAIAAGWIDVLQVAFSILDQRMRQRVFEAAKLADIGVVTRSAFLKGVLTERAKWLPPRLGPLRDGADRARQSMGVSWDQLPQTALRYCLAEERVASVLVGPSTQRELDQALDAVAAGPLPAPEFAAAVDLALTEETLIDPRLWPAL